MSAFHLTENGPKPCAAAPGNCPIGGEHFPDRVSAQDGYEQIMGGVVPSMTRTKSGDSAYRLFDPHTEEMSEALAKAPIYRKEAIVSVRVALPGEKLDTVLSDGTVETSRILTGGEQIATNPTGEEYAVSEATLQSRYLQLADGTWQAIGRVRAVRNPTGRPIVISAPWGGEQRGGRNCLIAEEVDRPGKRYIIGEHEFERSYQPEKDAVSASEKKDQQTSTTSEKLPQTVTQGRMKPMKGGSYYGTQINVIDIEPYLDAWSEHVGSDASTDMEEAKIARDGEYAFHATILSPAETRKLRKSGVEVPVDFTPQMKLTGVGTASDGDKTAWFVTIESEQVQSWRASVGLERKDLHVTLGFIGGDVHTQPKGADSIVIS